MKVKKIKDNYYLLSDMPAKPGEYALTATGNCVKMDLSAQVLWMDGCNRVLAAHRPYTVGMPTLTGIELLPEYDLQELIDRRNTTDRYNERMRRYDYSEADIHDIFEELTYPEWNVRVEMLGEMPKRDMRDCVAILEFIEK